VQRKPIEPQHEPRGNCWENAVAESFFSNLKSKEIKKRIYKTRQDRTGQEARSEVFEYIEGFYNPVRRHKHLDQLRPLEFERHQIALLRVSTKLGECQMSILRYGLKLATFIK